MKNRKQFSLEEAIKRHYHTEPFQPDFAASVADKVFGRKKSFASTLDILVYYTILIVCTITLIYCIRFISHLNLSPAEIFLIIPLIGYFCLSVKEMNILSKKYLELD